VGAGGRQVERPGAASPQGSTGRREPPEPERAAAPPAYAAGGALSGVSPPVRCQAGVTRGLASAGSNSTTKSG